MLLEKQTLIGQDYHDSFAVSPTVTTGQAFEYQAFHVSPATVDRAKKPLLEMSPWEWLRLASPERNSVPVGPIEAWRLFLENLGTEPDPATRALSLIEKYFHQQQMQPLFHLDDFGPLDPHNLVASLSSYGDSYSRLISDWETIPMEQRGLRILTEEQGHKVVAVTGLYGDLAAGFRCHLRQSGDWQRLANTPPETLPPAIFRAGMNRLTALPSAMPDFSLARTTHLGKDVVHPATADYKYLTHTLLAEIAKHLGMDYIAIDNDPPIVQMLTEAGLRVYTRTSIQEYRLYFKALLGLHFENYSELIDSYGGFNSGLAKLAGLSADYPNNTNVLLIQNRPSGHHMDESTPA